ncbi:TY-Chap domain-containing protein [Nocardia sp. NPDC004123]
MGRSRAATPGAWSRPLNGARPSRHLRTGHLRSSISRARRLPRPVGHGDTRPCNRLDERHDAGTAPVIDTADEDLEALPDRPRSWPQFSSALALTLNRLRSDEQLVLTMGQEGIAQFEMDWFEIGCFVRAGMSGGAVQPIPHADRAVMTANNWHAGLGPNEGWWERTMRWPARYEEFEAAADTVSHALRDIIGIGSPTDLQVTGWNNASDYSYPDITAFGVRR